MLLSCLMVTREHRSIAPSRHPLVRVGAILSERCRIETRKREHLLETLSLFVAFWREPSAFQRANTKEWVKWERQKGALWQTHGMNTPALGRLRALRQAIDWPGIISLLTTSHRGYQP